MGDQCLKKAEDHVRVQLIEELSEEQTLSKLVQDPYGNYVIQTALARADYHQKAVLEEHLKPILPVLRNTSYGKKIQSKLLHPL